MRPLQAHESSQRHLIARVVEERSIVAVSRGGHLWVTGFDSGDSRTTDLLLTPSVENA